MLHRASYRWWLIIRRRWIIKLFICLNDHANTQYVLWWLCFWELKLPSNGHKSGFSPSGSRSTITTWETTAEIHDMILTDWWITMVQYPSLLSPTCQCSYPQKCLLCSKTPWARWETGSAQHVKGQPAILEVKNNWNDGNTQSFWFTKNNKSAKSAGKPMASVSFRNAKGALLVEYMKNGHNYRVLLHRSLRQLRIAHGKWSSTSTAYEPTNLPFLVVYISRGNYIC